MSNNWRLVGVAVVLVTCGVFAQSNDEVFPDLLVEQVGPAPLPYQPIRLRFVLSNGSGKITRKLQYLESECYVTGIKGPTNFKFQPIGTASYLHFRPMMTTGTVPLYGRAISGKQHHLAPGEKQSVSGPFVGVGFWGNVRVLFPEPGEHTLRLEFLQNATEGPRLQAEPRLVTVGKPAGDDAAWFEFFQKKKNVADDFVTALAYGFGAQKREGGSLEALMVLYPKSSYVPYARYALAARLVYDYSRDRGAQRAELDEPRKLLEAIDLKDFAYAPDALVLMKRIKEYQQDEDGAAKIAARLQKEYPDAIEWFEEQARTRVPFEKIQENRKAGQAKPDPKKP
jgi:hypothetical protein